MAMARWFVLVGLLASGLALGQPGCESCSAAGGVDGVGGHPSSLEHQQDLGKLRFAIDEFDFAALRRAIEDLQATYPKQYAEGPDYLRRLSKFEADFEGLKQGLAKSRASAIHQAKRLLALRREALLANPLLDFQQLLVLRRSERTPMLGLPANWQGDCSLPPGNYDNELALLTMEYDGALVPVFAPEKNGFLGDVDLDFDAERLLFSMRDARGRFQIWEMSFAGGIPRHPARGKAPAIAVRQVTPGIEPDVDNYDACYLSDGRIVYASTACYEGIPCVFGGDSVANLCIMNPDGTGIRQLCFDQDHNWCPTVLPNGRVLYSRWEYADTPHSNTRLLFSMNPDGTNQAEYYGSNSYWPNSFFFARPIPNHPTKVVGIVSGHHGVRRMGELTILDPAISRREAEGALQRIPGFGKKVEMVFRDKLVDDSWPKFLHPYPLSDEYFLVSAQPTAQSSWGIYLADVFDNLLLIKEVPGSALFEPIPLRKTPRPPAIPDKIDPTQKNAVVYLADVYRGPGLQGVPRGTVRSLRVFSYQFAYRGMGGLLGMVGMDGPWDVRRILGTVPVESDGSALFRVPANTPIAVHPLDADGQALQQMRSWFTAMPGERVSCVGCHEPQNTPPVSDVTMAARRAPSEIQPWYGPARGFGFASEVQPVLDRYCVECHGAGSRPAEAPDLRGTETIRDWDSQIAGHADKALGGKFSVSYAELHRYVRRVGIESDYHMLEPLEYHADTTELVQLLRKGHHGVRMDTESWDRLITWIDFNAPFHGSWTSMLGAERVGAVAQRCKELRKQYANLDIDYETPPATACLGLPKLDRVPQPSSKPATKPAAPPLPAETPSRIIDLGNGQSIEMVLIPRGEFVMGHAQGVPDEQPESNIAIEKPFWISRNEIGNAQYAAFDPAHDSRVESKHGYQFGLHGFPMNEPEQPVVRVSWNEAVAFCSWLGGKTGLTISLPTEAQWEYACRAGAHTPFSFGGMESDYSASANIADQKLEELASNPYFVFKPLEHPNRYDDWIPRDHRYNDGAILTGPVDKGQPNAFGVRNMHGNVWEWTQSSMRPYPHSETDGRNKVDTDENRVARGGSWYDRPYRATASYRLDYPPWQRVFNVGFRVVCAAE